MLKTARCESSTSVSDIASLEPPLSTRCMSRTGFLLPLSGKSSNLGDSLFVSDFLHPDLLMLPQSPARLASAALVLDMQLTGSMLLLHSPTKLGFSLIALYSTLDTRMPILDCTTMDSLVSLRKLVRLDFLLLLLQATAFGSSMIALNAAMSDFPMMLRSCCHLDILLSFLQPCKLDIASPTTDLALSGFSLPPRSMSNTGLSMLLVGRFSIPSLLALDFVSLGSILPTQTFQRMDFALSVFGVALGVLLPAFDPLQLDFPLLLRQFGCLGTSLSAGLCYLGFFLSCLHCTHLEALLLLQNVACLDFPSLAFATRCDASAPALDSSCTELSIVPYLQFIRRQVRAQACKHIILLLRRCELFPT